MTSNDIFTPRDAKNILGVTNTDLQYWRNKGFIKPFREAIGRGDTSVYDMNDLLTLSLVREMHRARFANECILGILYQLPRFYDERLDYIIVSDGREVINLYKASENKTVPIKSGMFLIRVREFDIELKGKLMQSFEKLEPLMVQTG